MAFKTGLMITKALERTIEDHLFSITNHPNHTVLGIPKIVDWRKNPDNYITPIQDQGDCGSCVAFGTTAAIEGARTVADKNPTEDVKLSEADLFSHGGSCSGGWTLEAANSAAQQPGVCAEKCWPYNGVKQACVGNKFKTQGVTRLSSDAAVKAWIAANGPVQAAMDVYTDFFDVSDDTVYHQEYGDYAGGHCVCLVGYDDDKQAWILKNSWGTSWGSAGFCYIGYGECGLIRNYVAYGEIVASGPTPPVPPVPPVGSDVVLTKNGKVQVMLNVNRRAKGTVKSLLVNGTPTYTISAMKPLKYYVLPGTYNKGDKLVFELSTTSGNVHLDASAFGFSYWYLKSDNILFTVHQP